MRLPGMYRSRVRDMPDAGTSMTFANFGLLSLQRFSLFFATNDLGCSELVCSVDSLEHVLCLLCIMSMILKVSRCESLFHLSHI